MAKYILNGQASRKALIEGALAVADTVRVTMGPMGRNVMLTDQKGQAVILNDGVTIAESLELADVHQNMGARILREAALKTEELAGDGTTTSIVLARAILMEGSRNIAAGANPIELRKGLQGAVQLSCAAIRKMSRQVKRLEDLKRSATLAAGDERLGSLVAEAIERVGKEGVITVEESPDLLPGLVVTEGMQYEKGWLKTEFRRNPQDALEEIQDPYILITDRKITSAADLIPALEAVHGSGHPLVIIADEVSGEAMTMLMMNHLRGILQIMPVHPPLYGDGRRNFLEDICLFTGATLISESMGMTLSALTLDQLGRADKVTVGKNSTAILNGHGDRETIRDYLTSLRRQIEEEDYDFKKNRMKDRLARFTGGIAVLRAGGSTEIEMKEVKYRLEDALNAARAAAEEGIVPGGGTTYIDMLPAVRAYERSLEGDRRIGASILRRALEEPVRQIAENAGMDSSVIIEAVKTAGRGMGFDAMTGRICSMEEAGILDPSKVIRMALQSAASAAITLLTAEAGITNAIEEEEVGA